MGIVYLGYLSGTPIASGSNIPMTTIIRRYLSTVGTDMVIKGTGYYKVTIDATLGSTAGGDATLTLYRDGVAVSGATATETITATGYSHITLNAVIRNTCCDNQSILTIGYSGPVLTSTTATVVIEHA